MWYERKEDDGITYPRGRHFTARDSRTIALGFKTQGDGLSFAIEPGTALSDPNTRAYFSTDWVRVG